MGLKSELTGSEFVIHVSNAIGQELKFGEWIASFFDVFNSGAQSQIFEDFAFEAKSFQRLRRLLATGVSDKVAKEKIEVEIGATLKRFLALLEQAASSLGPNEREEFRKQFLDPSSSSSDSIVTLLDDFSKIKDFYLRERDARGKP